MGANRPVPTDTVLPHLTHETVAAAITSLTETFGFKSHSPYGAENGSVSGTQIHLGQAGIMLASGRDGAARPTRIGCHTQSLTVFVADIDAH